jgi:hypothetical protein
MNLRYKINSSRTLLAVAIALLAGSCNKAVDVNSTPVQLNLENIYTSDGSAEGVVSGLLGKLNNFSNGNGGLPINMGLYADELVNPVASSQSVTLSQYYADSLSGTGTSMWLTLYNQVYAANDIIQGLTGSASSSMTPAIRSRLLAETKFLRAFLYFYLVNLYGDVPLTTTTDYTANAVVARSPQAAVYQQIVQDLKDALTGLPGGSYVNASGAAATDRLRPNKQSASAFLARVYLYQGQWADAEVQADSVIGNALYTLEPNLSQVFLKGSREIIWQHQSISTSFFNNQDATYEIVTTTPSSGQLLQEPLNMQLVNAFDTLNDKRWTNWIGQYYAPASPTTPAATYYYAFKYKAYLMNAPNTENIICFRLAEQYLIRAEARAQQNNLGGAASDLNAIRSRAGLPPTTAASQSDLLAAILSERRLELFTEWGHRFFDLRRTNQLDATMTVAAPLKGGVWNTYKALLPLPALDIALDPNLIQNTGY